MDLEHAKRIGIAAAYNGARVLTTHFGNISRIDRKGAFDLVTEADTGSEQQIIKTIREAFPDHAILAEESGTGQKNSAYRTKTIVLHGFPTIIFCTAKSSLDEQESTRTLNLSAESTQEKIRKALEPQKPIDYNNRIDDLILDMGE